MVEKIKNVRERMAKGGLENKLNSRISSFLLLSFAGVALSFNSLTSTGYAISNLNQTPVGIFGAIIFIIGLIGSFISIFKKK